MVVSVLAGAAFLLFLQTLIPAPRFFVLALTGILTLCAFLFSSLTIRVTDRALCWHFGPGLIHMQVLLSEIEKAEPTRIRVVWGWGIHWTPRGWLYNVAGLGAVAVKLRTGKRFLLGTDEPERLCRALSLARDTRP